MAANELDNEPTQNESAQPAPRRRRAASRPAGPPPAVTVEAAAQAAVTAAEPVEQQPVRVESQPEMPTDGDRVQETPEPTPAPTRRRRATRAAAAPDPEPVGSAVRQPAAITPPPETPEPAALAAPVVPAALEAPEPKPASRRRRASRPAAAPEPPTESAGATSPAAEATSNAELVVEVPGDGATAQTAEGQATEGQAPAATRRRRSTRGEAAPVPVEDTATASEEDEDAIAVALRLAEQAARARQARLSDPFQASAIDTQTQLDLLAEAIATAEEADEEEPTEEPTEHDEAIAEGEAADEQDEEHDEEDEHDEGTDDDGRPRRRRRRGGRRRRRGSSRVDSGDADGSGDSESEEAEEASEAGPEDEQAREEGGEDADHDGEPDNGDGVTRRRRRRRRTGRSEESGSGNGSDEVTGIEGSTRMEAKRQRRKESRAASRRRAPILSEAEFLARRESVDRKLVIRQKEDYTQLAVVEDGILVEHYVDRAQAASLIGNVYLGRVQNVLPSMEAAFIDIGRGRNAVLYAGEVDWEGFGVTAEDRKVEKVFKSGQSVLVQVTKDPVGAKGARLTGHISLPGRYIVYSPGGHLSGVSRKLPDVERARLKQILGELISDDESVVVRTAAEGVSADELVRDVNRLKAQWEVIEKKVKQGKAPQALYSEPDLTLRIVRDLFTEDFRKLVVQGDGGQEDAFDEVQAYVSHVAPHLADRIERYEATDDGSDVFSQYRIDEQIAKALDRKVFLPSGGSLIIDRTEAMTVIDVNTGRFTGAGGNLEATVTSNNLEAAEEIVRQLRLRDLGGIIVIDFIDMVLPSNRELLLRRLVECLGRDRTRHQVAEVTSLGLVQLTRKRIGTGLAEAFTEPCDCCHGSGYVRFDEPVESQAPADGGDRRPGPHPRGGSRRRGGRHEEH